MVAAQHTRPFAEFLDRANSGTSAAQKITLEDDSGAASGVFGGDFFNKTRNVYVGWASVNTWRIKAK